MALQEPAASQVSAASQSLDFTSPHALPAGTFSLAHFCVASQTPFWQPTVNDAQSLSPLHAAPAPPAFVVEPPAPPPPALMGSGLLRSEQPATARIAKHQGK